MINLYCYNYLFNQSKEYLDKISIKREFIIDLHGNK